MLQFKRSLLVFVWLSILCGLAYPLAITGAAQIFFPAQSNATLIYKDNSVVGSQLIGQSFTRPEYFHGRPSATDPAYDASASGGSNLAPSSAKLIEQVQARIARVREENGLSDRASIPADLVLASASGLDPHISPHAAWLQVKRVAEKRNMPVADIESLIRRNTKQPLIGIWGEERVNVLRLNLALDEMKTAKP